MRVAAVQMNSTADKPANLAMAERLVRAAAADGAELVGLPEKWNLLGSPDELRAGAEPLDGPSLSAAASWARELGTAILAGSIAEAAGDGETLHNTSVLFDAGGRQVASYRKIHMFDVEVEGVAYRESEVEQPGEDIVDASLTAGSDELEVGLTICYDLRFPELYRILAVRGARLLTVPAAFTKPTGEAHWEVLLRARAVENQAFVLAPGQVGPAPPQYDSWGHSMIVDPWGRVLAEAGPRECFIASDIDLAEQDRIRAELPSLANRRPHSYLWPQLMEASV
ncbi:MAG: carbon-nitrogen hydrolase family protein [Solirubrobacterales bacterium]